MIISIKRSTARTGKSLNRINVILLVYIAEIAAICCSKASLGGDGRPDFSFEKAIHRKFVNIYLNSIAQSIMKKKKKTKPFNGTPSHRNFKFPTSDSSKRWRSYLV